MFFYYFLRYIKILKIKVIFSLIILVILIMVSMLLLEISDNSSSAPTTILSAADEGKIPTKNNDYAIIQVPGDFIKQFQKTSSNASYCNFNSFPINNNDDVVGTPELGLNSSYRVLYYVINYTSNTTQLSKIPQITLCTHATPEFIQHFTELLRYWNGLISLAIFVPSKDARVTIDYLKILCSCLPEMYRVSVHFVYPVHLPPNLEKDNEQDHQQPQQHPTAECQVPQISQTFRQLNSLVYPVNVCRNVARYGAVTRFILVSDVELIPSAGLAENFLKMIDRIESRILENREEEGDGVDGGGVVDVTQRMEMSTLSDSSHLSQQHQKHDGINKAENMYQILSSKNIFVVPVFEVEFNEKVPRTKVLLQEMYAENRIVYFHRWLCMHCQRFPSMQKWLTTSSITPNIIKPFLVVRREFPFHRWEPVFIGTNNDPLYSEHLSWEGLQDKMTQMLELCFQRYRFVVLDNAFLVHSPGVKRRARQHVDAWRHPHQKKNSYTYKKILEQFAQKYNKNPRCRLQ